MPIYRKILAQSWQILWRRPWLWLLGLLAAPFVNDYEYRLFLNSFDKLANPQQNWWWPGTITANYTNTGGAGQILLMILILIIAAIILWLMVTATGALFAASDSIANKKQGDLRAAWAKGKKHFWAVLGLVIIGKGLTVVLIMVAVAPVVLIAATATTNLTIIISALLSFIIFVPLAVIISFATKYGIAYAVLEEQTLGHALVNGWKLFWKNWLVSLEVALLLFAIGLALSVALVIISLIILVVVITVNTVLGTIGVPVLMNLSGFIILRVIASIIALPIVLIAGALLASFQTATWTVLFRGLTTKGIIPKILRWFKRQPKPSDLQSKSFHLAINKKPTSRSLRRKKT